MSSRTVAIRQPVSCEPCRKRKIKCSRTQVPCDTCRRRKCSESCIYLGAGAREGPGNGNEPNRDLLARIDMLEDMLRRHTQSAQSNQNESPSPSLHTDNIPSTTTYRDVRNDLLSPPLETAVQRSFGLSPESLSPSTSFSSYPLKSQGNLTASPSGDLRYEPRASRWTSVLANTGITAPMLNDDADSTEDALSFPFSAGPVPSKEELVMMLPPSRQCDYLKNRYFEVFSPLFHMLHDPTFHSHYDDFVADPNTVSLSWLAILFIVLSLAVTSLEEDDQILQELTRGRNPCQNIRVLSKRYREAAMKCLAKQGVFWGKHNIQSLQACIMLCYAMSHSQEQTWVFLGMTYNVATALACHVDPSQFDLNPIQAEERRRCWAGLIMLYTIQNAFLGNPDPTRQFSSSVQLPADANDLDITSTGIRPSRPGPTQMTYLLFKYQLYDLTACITSAIMKEEPVSSSHISALDTRISQVQESWDARYAYDTSNHSSSFPTSHKMHLHILHAYAHQLFLLLHRPFFAQSLLGLETPNSSQIRCIASAEALLDIHRLIHSTSEFKPYLWYSNGLGSFHAFHAAVVLAVACLMPIYKPQYPKFRNILDETLRRFESLGPRSAISARAAKVLTNLLRLPSPNLSSGLVLEPRFTGRASDSGSVPSSASGQSTGESRNGQNQSVTMGEDFSHFIAERLQPQNWLGPGSLAWNDWDDFLPEQPFMEGVIA